MTIRKGRSGVAALFVLGLVCPPAWGQTQPGGQIQPAVEGSWEGVVVYSPAELEVEIAVELLRDANGKLVGLIDIPTKPIDDEPLSNLKLDGNRISWELVRDSGTFLFDGTLSADGNEIKGRSVDRGKSYDFTLLRRDPAAAERKAVPPALHPLSATGAELKEKFNADAGNVRLVMLLSPG